MPRRRRKRLTETEIRGLPLGHLEAATLNTELPDEVRELARMHARAQQVKDLSRLEPIDHGVVARPHTLVYRMHRYWARRPWSVFNELLVHYSNPGSIVLDPFCGGGVTVVEGVRLGRRVVGADLSPLATWITRMELAHAEAHDLEVAYEHLARSIQANINDLYRTPCRHCGRGAVAHWIEHSAVGECPKCGRELVLAQTEKTKAKSRGAAGEGYVCTCSPKPFRPSRQPGHSDVLVRVSYECSACGAKEDAPALAFDTAAYARIEDECEQMLDAEGLTVPQECIPDGDLERGNALYAKGIERFADLFTARNVVANARLRSAILRLDCEPPLRDLLLFAFSSSLQHTNRMVRARSPDSAGGRLIEWAMGNFWIPDRPVEQNVWRAFSRRWDWVQRGLRWRREHLPKAREAGELSDLKDSATHLLHTGSSDNLPLPNESVDAVITDPPYGANVPYCELTDFWTVWLKGTGVLDEDTMPDGLVDAANEAIQTRHSGFADAKSLAHYRNMLLRIFKECHRVLKPGRWMVMTFHSQNFGVWNAIHAAAHDAGFVMPETDGMIYQPPIKQYRTTIQSRRTGAMLGDFIISFRRAARAPRRAMIPEVEVGSKVRKVAEEAIQYHGGASLSTIYTRLMPYLINNDLLAKVSEDDIAPFLRRAFELRTDEEGNELWSFKEDVERVDDDGVPLDFVPVEARIAYVIRSFLREKGHASLDEILDRVYAELINSNAAEYHEIGRVLNRACRLVKLERKRREVYVLKDTPEDQLELAGLVPDEDVGPDLDAPTKSESEHDLIIEDLARSGSQQGYGVHIGRAEQAKYALFKRWSTPMAHASEYGIPPQAFQRIVNIDTLWLKEKAIMSAFEVEKTTTIDSAITRFRELFAAVPNLTVETYIVIPDDRRAELERKLGSVANRRDGLTDKVRYLLFSDVLGKRGVDLGKMAHYVA